MDFKITLSVGAMSDDISEQLKVHGLFVENDFKYQNALDAVSRLFICGYIPEPVATKARNKIVKDVFKNIKIIGA